MKKFTAVLLAAFMVLSLAACSSGTPSEDSAAANGDSSAADTVSSAEASDIEETKPEETQPEETKPEETQPEETEPEETKPEETKPEETKPEETKPEESTEIEENDEISEPAVLLNTVWSYFGDDERFAVTGGDFSSGELIQEAASFGLSDPDALDYVTGFPAAQIGSIDSAASLMHMMNQNTFTSGAFHVVEGTDKTALNQAIRDNIMNRMWMCGFPDKMIVANVGDYVVSAFGKNQAMDSFTAHLVEAYPNAEIVFDEPIL